MSKKLSLWILAPRLANILEYFILIGIKYLNFRAKNLAFDLKWEQILSKKKYFFWLNWTFVTLCIDAWKIFIFLGFAVLWGSHAQMVETINRQNHFSIQSSLGTLIWQKVYKGPKYPAVKYPDYRQFHNKRITKRTRG